MSEQIPSLPTQRRSFLTRLSAGVTAFAVTLTGGAAMTRAQSGTTSRWQPERHEKDDWLDRLPGKHRLIFDTTTPDGFADAIVFANNFIRVNQTDYGLKNEDLAVVLVARHRSTPFAFNDTIWAKYGMPMASRANFMDPKTKQPPKANLFNAAGYETQLPNRGVTLESVLKQGAQLAVCQIATRGYAAVVAEAIGGNTDTIYNEMVSSIGNNARMVPAGIVAVNRAQERGYSFVSA
jgi:hypothetical protein